MKHATDSEVGNNVGLTAAGGEKRCPPKVHIKMKKTGKNTPFFARFLTTQDLSSASGGSKVKTQKYPSDAEDGGVQTQKYPSDKEDS